MLRKFSLYIWSFPREWSSSQPAEDHHCGGTELRDLGVMIPDGTFTVGPSVMLDSRFNSSDSVPLFPWKCLRLGSWRQYARHGNTALRDTLKLLI